MRFTTILSVAAFAGAALAQNQQGQPGAGCAAQNVLTACLSTQGSRISQCKTLDYGCMCTVQADVLQCYDQCPNDVNRSTEQSKLTAYCVAASAAAPVSTPTPASTFSVETTGSAPAPTQTESGDDATPTDSADGSSTETEAPTGTKSSNGKAATSEPAGSSAAKITWMCASSLMAVLTAAFMAL
ncbi:hypothetical protein TWF730_003380 [Orbilia blumenaviensis]|uniref:GPI anchored serine-threonine rich protein n=1 Tax=Orbilia blumenaviensis TaxID=1796055 RepID=A0AAV9U8N0_9PEZI